MSDTAEFLEILGRGDTLGVARLAAEAAHSGGDSRLAVNAALYAPGSREADDRIQAEKARHLELLADAGDRLRAVLLFNLGCFALYQDDILTAKLRFAEAARLRPDHHPSLHNLAHAHELMADFEDAKVELGRALNVKPGCALTKINLGAIHLIEGEAEAGLALLRGLAAAQPDNMGVALHLCRSLLERRGQAEAEEVVRLLDERPQSAHHPELKACRAYAAFLLGNWGEAEALFRELLETEPDSEFARMGLIKALAPLEKFDELLEQLQHYGALPAALPVEHVIERIRRN